MAYPNRVKGFTLIELIMVIVLLGIIGSFTFGYLKFGTQIFTDAIGRDQLVSQSRFAVERLSRELRNSLPRSVRISSDQRCIELVPILSSSSYVQLPQPGATAHLTFIGVTPLNEHGAQSVGQSLFVYAANQSLIYGISSAQKAVIANETLHSSNDGLTEFTFTTTNQTFTTGSPARRFFITEQPVSWCLYNGSLVRYAGYGFSPNQPSLSILQQDTATQKETMAQQLYNNLSDPSQYPFRVFEATLQRNSLVQLDWRFGRANDAEPLRIQHEVFIPNVP